MSTGKRIAKRSILGTRVACSLEDGKYYPGIICDVKAREDCGPSIYSVRVEGDRRTRDLREGDLVGSCFTSVNSVKLRSEQKVFITYNNREVNGNVIYHRPNIDEVLISVINPETNQRQDVKKRLEEVRLLESRKSPRLADQDTDFAKLADCSSANERAIARKSSSITIDVPDGVSNGSRKRRGSRSDEDLTDECAAALVLMKLSCSPRSPVMQEVPNDSVSGASSVSSGVWSLKSGLPIRSVTPSPPLSDASPSPTTDDGIELDDVLYDDIVPRKRRSSTRTMFKCTWKDCSELAGSCFVIEKHIRTQHLGRLAVGSDSESDSEDDHEEEFYWTEMEVNMATNIDHVVTSPPSGHTTGGPVAPKYVTPPRAISTVPQQTVQFVTPQHQINFGTISQPIGTISYPSGLISHSSGTITHHHGTISRETPPPPMPFAAFVSSPPTLSHMDMARPPHEDPDYRRQYGCASLLSSSWPKSSSYFAANRGKNRVGAVLKTPSGRGKRNGESRKCRKVYGMEQKDQWCTQCKWKKACSRFGE